MREKWGSATKPPLLQGAALVLLEAAAVAVAAAVVALFADATEVGPLIVAGL
jgi:hypothetical protein